ncbi:hypothetical protein AB0L40_07210 [Patulibacter sp. NPDC049589]|uniref:alpha/beta hydrolase family protein n=1 Tax=Patulibacter sp. NPDC049589 TaxID=3154731 RepID=UPI003431EE7B
MHPSASHRSPSLRRARRVLLGGALTIGVAAALPSGASAAPATWSEFAPLALPQPGKVWQATDQKMIMVAIPGGGWGAGTNTLLDLYGYMDWWSKLAQSKGISVHVITSREGGFAGAVPLEIADLGAALGKVHTDNPGVPICVYGLSSGGHLAAMLQILRPDITQCVVSDGGPLDMEAFFQDSSELRGITLGDFFQGQVAQTAVREWFNTPEHPDNVSRLDPSTQTNRIGDLFAIEAGPNPDGSAADRSVGDRQGESIRSKIPNRTTVRYVHAALDGQDSLPTAHNLYSTFLDGSPGGAEATEARKIYTEAADWMLKQAAKAKAASAALTPQVAVTPPAPVVAPQRLAISLRSLAVRPDARGRVPVKIRCTGATTACKGTVRLTFGGVASKATSYKVTTKKSTFATVLVPLAARQIAYLTPRRSVTARVRLTGTSPGAKAVTRNTNISVVRTLALARKDAAAKKQAAAAKKKKAAAKKR